MPLSIGDVVYMVTDRGWQASWPSFIFKPPLDPTWTKHHAIKLNTFKIHLNTLSSFISLIVL